MHAYGWRMIYAKYDCILIWLRCQIFNKIIKQLKYKVTLENLRGTVLQAKIFDIAAGHFHCMVESVCVCDLIYVIKCLLHVGISLEFTTHTKPFISVDLDKNIYCRLWLFSTHNFNIRLCFSEACASWTLNQHLNLPSLYSVHFLSI